MLKKVFLLAVIAMLISCSDEQAVPEQIISEEKMVAVLIDIRIAEGKVDGLSIPPDSAKSLFKYVENKILEKHEVDSAAYMESYAYYMLDSDQFLKITDVVLDSLKVRLKKVSAPK